MWGVMCDASWRESEVWRPFAGLRDGNEPIPEPSGLCGRQGSGVAPGLKQYLVLVAIGKSGRELHPTCGACGIARTKSGQRINIRLVHCHCARDELPLRVKPAVWECLFKRSLRFLVVPFSDRGDDVRIEGDVPEIVDQSVAHQLCRVPSRMTLAEFQKDEHVAGVTVDGIVEPVLPEVQVVPPSEKNLRRTMHVIKCGVK